MTADGSATDGAGEQEVPVYLISMHVTHAWVDIEHLELAAAKEARSTLQRLAAKEVIDEVVLLSTCNRVELYVATREPRAARAALEELAAADDHGDPGIFRFYTGEDTVRHLLRVASGVESMIVGEDQILGQVRQALEFARKEGTIGPELTHLFEKALHVGKRARAETRVGRGAVSVGSAAVDLARSILGDLAGKTVGIVGAGEVALLVAKALVDRKVQAILVANRTPGRALEVAHALHGEVVPYDRMTEVLQRADVVIVATSAPHVILTKDDLHKADRPAGRTLLLVDLGVPRNVEPDVGQLPGIRLESIDSLRAIASQNLSHRREEIEKVGEIIEAELGRYIEKMKARDAEFLIRELYEQARRIRDEELQRAIAKLKGIGDLSARQEDVLRDLVNAVVNKILATPTLSLKAASKRGDRDALVGAKKLFRFDDAAGESVEDGL